MTRGITLPDAAACQAAIRRMWSAGQRTGAPDVDFAFGDLRRRLGGYPGPYIMPKCGHVMRLMAAGDRLLAG